MNDWYAFVVQTGGTANQSALSRRTGIGQSTFSKWKSGIAPTPESASAFARSLGRNPLEAFVAAGWLTAREAGAVPASPPSVHDLTSSELLSELERRLTGRVRSR